jgi:release factor glutamine methyltransferase
LTVREALARARLEFERAGVDTPQADAEWLLAHVLGASRASQHLRTSDLGERELTRFAALVDRRRAREPLAYVLGEWGFRRLTLRTDARALVPRPETEIVVERCLAVIRDLPEPRVIDVGTGSGAIALAIADEHPRARIVGLDASADALSLARENLEWTGFTDRVELVVADVQEPLPGGPYDLVVANPPYVPAAEIETLAPEVRDWEPRAAILDTGQSELVERAARDVLEQGGALVVETHWNGARRAADRLVALGYHGVTITRDLGGRERVVEGRRP